MFKKAHGKKLEQAKIEEMKSSFQNILSRVKSYVFSSIEGYSNLERIELLSFVLTVIKKDIQSEYLSEIFYKNGSVEVSEIDYPFPHFAEDEKGNTLFFYKDDEKEWVDLSSEIVMSCPWELSRYFNAANNVLQNGFEYIPSNHFGVYYSYLNFGYVNNGIHHVSVASSLKTGKIKLPVCDIRIMFPHIKTDGVSWYSTHTNKRLYPVWNIRCAIMYEICKMKYELETAD